MTRPERPEEAPPVSILVDARALHGSGIGRYLRGVLSAVLVDPRFGPVTLVGEERRLRAFVAERAQGRRIAVEPLPGGLYSPRAQLGWLARRLRRAPDADVSFFPHYDAPLLLPARSVVTIHDLIHFRRPEFFPASRRLVGGMLMDRVARGAARVLTVSEATRADLVARLPEVAGKVQVVHNGVESTFRPVPEASLPPEVVELRPFLLCVGNRKPHKNLGAAVEALAELRREAPGMRLVIAGGDADDDWGRVLALAERLGVRGAITDLRDVADDLLRSLYGACEALLFPSLYEGFGLPLLEAMACGAPVVASDASSIPEVVGDAGLIVPGGEARGLAEGVRRLRREPELRRALIARGLARAAELSAGRAASRSADALYAAARGWPVPPPASAPRPGSAR